MAFCTNCGVKGADDMANCPSCGAVQNLGKARMDQAKGFFASLFDFSMKEVITPRIIQILYLIGVVVLALAALIFFIMILATGEALIILGALILVPIGFLLYVVFFRVYMELIMVFFNILAEIRAKK